MRYWLLLLSVVSLSAAAQPAGLAQLDTKERAVRQGMDLQAIQIYRSGLARTLDFVRSRADLFPETPIEKRLMPEDAKRTVRSTWKALLDYQIALDALQRYHTDFYLLAERPARERSLLAAYAALAAQYRFALDFIARAENDPELAKVLNEQVTELGLEAGSYDKFKFRFLNVAIGTEFAALSALQGASKGEVAAAIDSGLAADSRRIWEMGRGKGEVMTVANALAMVRGFGQRTIFPAQAGISEWMGDTKVWRQDHALISTAQVAELTPKMMPGDVMLERREWYVSNVGLPGFWSHAAIYIGTPAERRAYFADPVVQAWVKSQGIADGDMEKLLAQRYPDAYATGRQPQEHGHAARVLEAISEGVSFTSMEHSASADSLVVLRPRLTKKDKAFALLRAFGYAGRPYDFDFDFQTDAALVCTELVYKAYEPAPSFKGIPIQLEDIIGRLAIPANGIARQFDEQYGTADQQWDMVQFLDGSERQQRAVKADLATFRAGWQRPKWHVLLPETRQAGVDSK
jgi:uncharacterized protein YycO